MMFLFWLIIALMVIIALAFVLWPLLRTQKPFLPSHDEANVRLYQNQLQHLEQDLETNTITPQIYRQFKKEIERGLLQDVETVPEKSKKATIKPDRITASILLVFVAAFSISLYFKWGDSVQLKKYYAERAHAAEIDAEIKTFKSPQQLIDKMQAVLQQHPDSAQGWFLLGRLYTSTNQLDKAQAVYAKAVALAPTNLQYKLQYAQADFFGSKEKLSATAAEYLNDVLKKEPNNPEAINLFALNAFSEKQYQIAINNWEKLLNYFPANSKEGQVIMNAIHEAQLRIHPAKPAA